MTDLISRQAAINALDERCESECEYSKKQRSIMCDACYLGSAKEVIESLPTIEPKRGKWEYIGGYGYQYRCSNCIMCAEKKTAYCPNCGARMKGSEE